MAICYFIISPPLSGCIKSLFTSEEKAGDFSRMEGAGRREKVERTMGEKKIFHLARAFREPAFIYLW